MWRWLLPNFYLAARLFSPEELARNIRIVERGTQYGNFFVPQIHGALLRELVAHKMPVDEAEERVFRVDVHRGLDPCHACVCIYEGEDVDSGVAWEEAYSFATGKTCVALRVDGILPLPTGDNPMVKRSLTYKRVFTNEEDLFAWMHQFSRWYSVRLITSLASVALVTGAGLWHLFA